MGWIAGATAVRQRQFICSGAATANITPQKTSKLADSFHEVPRMGIGKTVSRAVFNANKEYL
ncbi:MAG: hypothetical protein ACJ8DY_06245 [Xanthobacteraceae bacterium]